MQKDNPVILRAEEFLSSVQKSLAVISPPQKLYPWLFEHSALFEKAFKRQVYVRILTEKSANIPESFNENLKTGLFEMRLLRKPPTISFGIYDRKRVILELQGDNGYLASQALISDNPCIVDLSFNYFKFEWTHAKKVVV